MASGRLLKKDFELFKKEAMRWVDILGLKDYEWHFIFGDTDPGNRAEFITNITGKMVTVYLAENMKKDEVSKDLIRKYAFHEVVEAGLLIDLRTLATRDSSYEKVDEATHKIVRTLENVLFPKY